jgi:LysR family transcriptional regulator of abg operon
VDRALEQFVAVAEAGTIVGAAALLRLSQPALTYALKKLEQSLGATLFERTPRGVRLTAEGETLYQHAVIMRRLYGNAVATIERQRAARAHGLSVGSGYSAWTLVLQDLIIARGRAHPTAPINVSLGSAVRLMDQLLAGDIALFVGQRIANLARPVDADFIPLGLTRDGYFVRDGHALLAAPRSRAEVLDHPTTLAFPPEGRLSRLVASGAEADLSPGSAGHGFTCSSLEACVAFAAATEAVLIHTDLMAPRFAVQGLRPVMMLPGEAPRLWPMGIYVLRERRPDSCVAAFIDEIVAATMVLHLPPVRD